MSLATSLGQNELFLDEDDLGGSIDGILDLFLGDLDDGSSPPAGEPENKHEHKHEREHAHAHAHTQQVHDNGACAEAKQPSSRPSPPPPFPPPSRTLPLPLPLPLPHSQFSLSPPLQQAPTARRNGTMGVSSETDEAESTGSASGSGSNDRDGSTGARATTPNPAVDANADAGVGSTGACSPGGGAAAAAAGGVDLSPRSRRLQRNRASASRSRRRRQQQLQTQAAQVAELESQLRSMSTELHRSEARCDTLAAQNSFLQRMLLKLDIRVDGHVPLPLIGGTADATADTPLSQHAQHTRTQQARTQHAARLPWLSPGASVVSGRSHQTPSGTVDASACSAATTTTSHADAAARAGAGASDRPGRKRPRSSASGGGVAPRPHAVAILSVCVLAVFAPAGGPDFGHTHTPVVRTAAGGRRLLSLPAPAPSRPATMMPTVAASVHSMAASMIHVPIHALFRDLCPLHHHHHHSNRRQRHKTRRPSRPGGQQQHGGSRTRLQRAAALVALLLRAAACAAGLQACSRLRSGSKTPISMRHGKPAALRGSPGTAVARAVQKGLWDPALRFTTLWAAWRGDDGMRLPG